MQVSEIMKKGISSVTVNDTIKKVAQLMKQEDIGAVPILENNKPIGIVTDRDIVIDCIAEGQSFDQPISRAMKKDVVCVRENQDIEEASRLMQERQISRILVVNDSERPVGMLSLHDLANYRDQKKQGEVISEIKQ